jgi:cytidylate kinase
VITIDGPAGAGKSTVAQALARRLGYRLLDTGAMYRALAWSVEQAGLTAEDTPALRRHLSDVDVELRNDGVFVDGRDVSGDIRTPAIDKLTSMLTVLEPVRQKITPLQRRLSGPGGVILEGRDTGTVVCPDAEVKFFLNASLEERARRRQAQFAARGLVTDFATVLDEVRARDAQDTTRALAPLVRAADAVEIDTTALTVEQIVERMVREIEERCSTRS